MNKSWWANQPTVRVLSKPTPRLFRARRSRVRRWVVTGVGRISLGLRMTWDRLKEGSSDDDPTAW